MAQTIKKAIASVVLVAVTLFGQGGFFMPKAGDRVVAQQYEEHADTISNPDRGFYKAIAIHLTGNEDGSPLYSADYFQNALDRVDGATILHLRFNLAAFSSNGKYSDNAGSHTGTTKDIPAKTLQSISKTLEEIRKSTRRR